MSLKALTQDLSILTAIISFIASLGMLCCFALVPRLRSFAFKLVTMLALCDFMYCVGILIGTPSGGGAWCFLQAYIISFFELAGILWTTVIARTLHVTLSKPQQALGMHKKLPRYHFYCWGIAGLATLLPQLTNSYGSAGTFCWIRGGDTVDSQESVDSLWRFVQFYAPLWLAMCYNTRVYYKSRKRMQRAMGNKARGGLSLLLYPAVLLLCWSFATVNRLQNWANPGHPVDWLFLLQVVTSNMQGLLHACVYLSTEKVRSEVRARVTGDYSRIPNATPGSTGDGPQARGSSGDAEGHDEGLLAAAGGVSGAGGDAVLEPATRPRRRSSVTEIAQAQLTDVSHQIRAAYFASLGMYALMGVEDDSHSALAASSRPGLRSRAPTEDDVDVDDIEVGDEEEMLGGAPPQGTATVMQTYFVLGKCFVGIGILAMPHAFAQAGYVGAVVGLTVCGYACYYCMVMLVKCKERMLEEKPNQLVTFASVAQRAVGAKGAMVVNVSLVVAQAGFVTSYLIFVGENLADVTNSFISRDVYVMLGAALVAPLVCLKTLSKLAFGALVADAAILIGLSTVMYYSVVAMQGEQVQVDSFHASSFPVFLGIAVFAYEGVAVVLPTHQAMAQPKEFVPILRNVVAGYTMLIVVVAIMGYAAFGNDTEAIIMLNLPRSVMTIIVQLLYSAALILSAPIVLFPAIQILERCSCYRRRRDIIMHSEDWTSRVYRTFIVLVVAIAGLVIPHFGLFVSLIGSGAGTMLSFILPTWLHYYLHPVEMKKTWPRVRSLMLMSLGVIGGGIGFAVSLVELINAK